MVGAAVWLMIGATATGPKRPPRAESSASTLTAKPVQDAPGAILRCPGARKGLDWYKDRYAQHRAVQRLPGPPETVRYSCLTTIRRAAEWRDRAASERARAASWVEYHFDWQRWLPWNWRHLGSCETGYGGDPNFAHSVTGFVSAFGITRTNYAIDARWAGGPQWSDDPAKRPTPRQQYQAALAHYAHHGDGWGCPGP